MQSKINLSWLIMMFSLLIASCGENTLQSTTTATNVPFTQLTPVQYLISPIDLSKWISTTTSRVANRLSDEISPDGRWVLLSDFYPLNKPNVIRVASFPDLNQFIESPLEENLGRTPTPGVGIYMQISDNPWSPDSTAFVLIGYDRPREGSCDFLVLFELVDQNRIEKKIIELDANLSQICPQLIWSSDGSNLAILYGHGEIQIVDRKGNEVAFSGFLPEYSASMVWSKQGIYITAPSKLTVDHGLILSDIYFVHPYKDYLDPGYWERIYTQDTAIQIVGIDPTESQLLLISEDTRIPSIFDIQKQHITKTLSVRADLFFHSTPSQYIATTSNCGENKCLWIFDWGVQTFQFYGYIDYLMSWYSPLNGFLVKFINGQYGVISPE